jgi:chaperonin cofactor prefoldin
METALGVVADKGGEDVLDFMGYAVGRSVCDDYRPALSPMVKGWLYSLNPDFMKAEFDEHVSYDTWVGEQKRKFGDNLSVPPMPERELAGINTLIETVEAAKQLAEDKEAEADEANAATDAANAEIKALTPFKKKAEDLEAKLAQLEEKNKTLAAEVAELKEKLAAFDGKVAIDEKEIEKSVKEIVTRAVGSIAAAGGVVAAAAEGGDAAASADFAADSSSGGVPDSFGFGASGSNDDGFGF